jgi:hypothetical protein
VGLARAVGKGRRDRFQRACTHGTWPWRAQHERRNLLYKFAPGHSAWASPYPSPKDAPKIHYPEQLEQILEQPYVAQMPDASDIRYRKNVE